MTTVPATTSTPTTPAATGSTTDNSAAGLSGNFNTFLTLLTTQLQNQDPMNPMDSNQFTQELVQFSGVEQQINTNTNLQTFIGLQQSNAGTQAVSYLGKNITITNGAGLLSDSDANWSYALDSGSAATKLTVSDSTGKVVYTQAGATASGQHDFEWNGLDNNGVQMPDGTYTLSVSAVASDGSTVQSAVASQGVVSEVNFTGSQPYLMIGSMAVPVSQVSAVNASN